MYLYLYLYGMRTNGIGLWYLKERLKLRELGKDIFMLGKKGLSFFFRGGGGQVCVSHPLTPE